MIAVTTLFCDVEELNSKYRKERKRQTRNGIEQFARLWATDVALVNPMTKDEEKI